MAASGGEKAKSTIIIKRIKKGGHGGHHGGAWKIAYADFVTAMMAFFLLMWLLGSTTKGDLKGIADYFQSPLQVALSGGSGAGDATTLIQGGGADLTRDVGQIKRGDNAHVSRRTQLALMRAESKRMKQLDEKIEAALEADPKFNEFRDQVRIDITPDGLRIQIIDDFKRPMFDMGGTQVKDYLRDILRQIGAVLDGVDSHITISGHTDSAPYAGGQRGYSNWELSAARAIAVVKFLNSKGIPNEHLVAAGHLRIEHAQASLEELGALADPPMTKDAVAGRIRRLLAMADKRASELGEPGTEAGLTADMLVP